MRPQRPVFRTIVPIFAVVVAMILLREAGHSTERDWRATHLNQFGEPCCDDTDCREIATDVALRLRLGEFAKVGEYVHTPVNVIYPTQDDRSWICTTGCLFRPYLN